MKLTRKGKLNSSCIPRRFWVTVASTALYFPCSFEISSISSKNNKHKYNFIFIDKIIYFISLYYVFFHQEIIAMQWNLIFILCFKVNFTRFKNEISLCDYHWLVLLLSALQHLHISLQEYFHRRSFIVDNRDINSWLLFYIDSRNH